MDYEDNSAGLIDSVSQEQSDSGMQATSGGTPTDADETAQAQKAKVSEIIKNIKADKKHHDKAFKRMRRDMFVTFHGREEDWSEKKYKANIAGRHVRQKTSTLYAKNPKVAARRRETLDFQLWDENEQTLVMALQTVAAAGQMQGLLPGSPSPAMAAAATAGAPFAMQQQMPPGFQEAQMLIADFQQGVARRKQIKQFGRTLEILFSHYQREQKPLNFKDSMKQVVRRACTTGVGYVELDYQREMGPRPAAQEKLADYQARLAHLKYLMEEAAEGEYDDNDPEMAELEAAIAALQQEPEIVLREGLIFDFPQSTKVIPDKNCTQLFGFVGADHLAIEYLYPKCKVEEIFDCDLEDEYTPYQKNGKRSNQYTSPDGDDTQGELFRSDKEHSTNDYVCVWKYYDKPTGLVYYVCDGHKKFLREPAAPNVTVSDFWPVYALTFNAVENEDEVFPPSDVTLLLDMQREYNRSREGKREHRKAARPRWGYSNGAFDEEDIEQLKRSEAFDVIGLNIDPNAKLADVLQGIPVPGVDPNLYDTNEILQDVEIVAGSQRSQLASPAKATATAVAAAAQSTSESDSSSIDDLDAFLTVVARGAGEVLMREVSEDTARRIAGPGAVWVEQTTSEIFEEVYLEIEAGSSGKPNQAVEINNWQQMLPFLLQMGSIPSTWLARETLRRLDDRMDLTEAVVDGIPSIVAQNAMAQPSTGNAQTSPEQQGGNGSNNAPAAPGGPAGSDAPMGDNHTTPGVVRYGPDGKRVQQ